MKTLTIQIGNSDDKLSQREWSSFVGQMSEVIGFSGADIHFMGGPSNWARFQNACWVIAIQEIELEKLLNEIRELRKRFRQESAAVTVGDTQFI